MEWTDDAIILRVRKHGEANAIVNLLSESHGHHAGLVRGGASSRHRAVVQPGNQVRVTWRARLAEHLGSMRCEPIRALGIPTMGNAEKLAALNAACAVAVAALPEREPYPLCYQSFQRFLEALAGADFYRPFIGWEQSLLAELGYGLDLSGCAVTGETENLAYISPRTGRAVSAAAGADYADRLLPLPSSVLAMASGESPAPVSVSLSEVHKGLSVTSWFLKRHIFDLLNRPLPEARVRFQERLSP